MPSPPTPLPAAKCIKKSIRFSLPVHPCVTAFSLFLIVTASVWGQSPGGIFDGPAELPRVYLQSTLADTPAPGHTIQVNIGGDFQKALDSASCGDTVELHAGTSFAGTFTLPQNPCDNDHWIIIRTSADSLLPPEGTRITPCYAGVVALPARPDFHCASSKNVMARVVQIKPGLSGPILLAAGANHYRLVGLEITRLPANGSTVNLIEALANSDHIVLDRVWVHGTARDETRRGISLSGTTNVSIVDSFFSDFHCLSVSGSCTDSQAIGGGSSDLPGGPYKIVNNFLEAAGECILFGGDPSTTTPNDIEIRHNHLFKPFIWQPGYPGFVGGASGDPFIVKNHFELKNAQRVLFEGNILENDWGGFTQHGFSILLTPKGNTVNSGSRVNRCAICQVTDITIRYNTISHIGGGFTIATVLTVGNGTGVPAMAGGRFSIHDVLLTDIDSQKYFGNGTLFLVSNGWSRNVLNKVTVNHITAWPGPDWHVLTVEDSILTPKISGFVFTNNLVGAGRYPVWGAGGGSTNCAQPGIPITMLAACFRNYSFASNVFISLPASNKPSNWPTGNYFAADPDAVGFVDYDGGDYELLPSSPYKNKATDGTDLGADINAIQTATSGAD